MHEPLVDEDYIRLLSIGSVSDTMIHCTMCQQERPLEALTSNYVAVSYCWGDNSTAEKIMINGKQFEVPSNLYSGLKAMHRNLDLSSEWLWIDAICIDQTNTPEKSAQVRRMHTTYRDAQSVLVWLGEEADNSECAMRVLRWLSVRGNLNETIMFEDPSPLHEIRSKLEADNIPEASLLALEAYIGSFDGLEIDMSIPDEFLNCELIQQAILPPYHPFWRDFLLLVNRPWFFRVWTFQEIRLASRALVLCGDEAVDWGIMRRCRAGIQRSTELIDMSKWRRTVIPSPESDLYFTIRMFDGLETLRICLMGVPGRDAKDPRDFIYGYLGLLSEEVAPSITVDYGTPASHVFREAVLFLIQAHQSAAIWTQLLSQSLVEPKTRTPGLPSWCPDLSNRLRNTLAFPFATGEFMAQAVLDTRFDYGVEVSDDRLRLRVYGIPLDTVVGACKQSIPDGVDCEDDRKVILATKQWLDAIDEMFSGSNDRVSLTHTWLQSYCYRAPSGSHEPRKYTLDDLRQACTDCESTEDYDDCLDLLVSLGWPSFDAGTLLDDLAIASYSSRGRYYFITQHGRIGFAPKQIHVGQRICYFPGGGYLQILSSGYDEFVASAFVDGLMGDALLPILKDEALRPFELH